MNTEYEYYKTRYQHDSKIDLIMRENIENGEIFVYITPKYQRFGNPYWERIYVNELKNVLFANAIEATDEEVLLEML